MQEREAESWQRQKKRGEIQAGEMTGPELRKFKLGQMRRWKGEEGKHRKEWRSELQLCGGCCTS